MKTNWILFFSILLSLLNACKAPTPKNISAVETQTDQGYSQIGPCYATDKKVLIAPSSRNSRLVKVIKKDTTTGIDMGYYLLPDCWSSTKTGLQGPDSTTVTDYPIFSKAKLHTDFGATELLGYQAIVDEYIKEHIVPELFQTKARIKSITHSEAITHQFNTHFNRLFPCSAAPVHFYVTAIEDQDLKGNPGLTVLYFMIFKLDYGYVLHYSKNEMTSKPETYEQHKKEYLYALAHAEYTPEFIQRTHQSQQESPVDGWYQYNQQLIHNEYSREWHYYNDPSFRRPFRPWKSNRYGDHDDFLNAIDSSYYLPTDELYDPANY